LPWPPPFCITFVRSLLQLLQIPTRQSQRALHRGGQRRPERSAKAPAAASQPPHVLFFLEPFVLEEAADRALRVARSSPDRGTNGQRTLPGPGISRDVPDEGRARADRRLHRLERAVVALEEYALAGARHPQEDARHEHDAAGIRDRLPDMSPIPPDKPADRQAQVATDAAHVSMRQRQIRPQRSTALAAPRAPEANAPLKGRNQSSPSR